ncbi:hypothetical protein MUU75_01665 [Pseudoxanthomonas mexicana]|uniref:hypothetical protein n=1 Tax=Pseudoxanthomonas mexicana TaxID=128785 RepID=UPI001FD639AD|nr:hypothetical protein [Pseudoxanthomonas mexicana]UOV05463.1 hypothetical protein MUU75_01665 [Pseudoxanthomonas mexicana]
MDIALLTRHRLWAWIVLVCTPEIDSWRALDEHWLAKVDGGTATQRPLRKVFQRYYHVGNDPGKLRGINGRKLVEAVHADPHQSAAAALYTSPFWLLTGPEVPTPDQIRAIHADLLRRLGLVRLTPTQRAVAINCGFENVARDNQDLRTIAENAYNIGERASVDAIALLACCFRLALDALSLKEADVYLDALRWSLRHFLTRWDAHELVSQALGTLIEVRLLRRSASPVSAELLGFRTRRDRRYAEPTVPSEHDFRHIGVLKRGEISYTSPIVPMDGYMEAFFDDFDKNCRLLRNQIVQRLSNGDKDLKLKEKSNVIRQQRRDLIDDILLGNLNASDEDAVEMLRHISKWQALGGLAGVLDEFFNPNAEHLATTQHEVSTRRRI